MAKFNGKRILSLLLALTLVVTMMTGMALTASAADTAIASISKAMDAAASSVWGSGYQATSFVDRTGTSAGTAIGGKYGNWAATTSTSGVKFIEYAPTFAGVTSTYVYSFDFYTDTSMTKGFAAVIGNRTKTATAVNPAFCYDAVNGRFYVSKFADDGSFFGGTMPVVPTGTGAAVTDASTVTTGKWYSVKMVIDLTALTATGYYRDTEEDTTYTKIGTTTGIRTWTNATARQHFAAWTTTATQPVSINLDNINLSKPDVKSVTVDYSDATKTAYSAGGYAVERGTAVNPVFTCLAKWYLNQTGYTVDPATATVDIPNNAAVVTFAKATSQPSGDNTTFTASTGTLAIPADAPVGVYTIEGKSAITAATVDSKTFEITEPTASGVVTMGLASSNGDTLTVDPAGIDTTTAMSASYSVNGISEPSTTYSVDAGATALGITINETTGALSIPKDAAIAQSGTPTTITVTGTSSADLASAPGTKATATKVLTLKAPLKAASFTLSGPDAVVVNDATKSYTVSAVTDQYGSAIAGRTTNWEVVGTGASIDANGLLTAGADIADVTVKATIDDVVNTMPVCIANYTGINPTGTLNTNYTYANVDGETVLKALATPVAFPFTNNQLATINSDFMITALPTNALYYQHIYAFTYGGGQCTNGSISVGSNGSIVNNSGSGVFTQFLPAGTVEAGKWYNIKAYVYLKAGSPVNTTSASFAVAITPVDTGITTLSNAVAARNAGTYTSLNLFVGGMNSGHTSTGTILFKNTISETSGIDPTVTTTVTGDGTVTLGGVDATLAAAEATGQSQTKAYTITPGTGKKIGSVLFNGTDVTSSVASGVYTTPFITANSTLIVTFADIATYAMEATVTGNVGGTATVDASPVTEGGTAVFTITPADHFTIDTVTYNTTPVDKATEIVAGSTAGTFTYTVENVAAAGSLVVTFVEDAKNTVTASVGVDAKGSVDKASEDVYVGNNATFTAIPDTGYEIDTVEADDSGVTVSVIGNAITVSAITKAVTITVTFKEKAKVAPVVVSLAPQARAAYDIDYNGSPTRLPSSVIIYSTVTNNDAMTVLEQGVILKDTTNNKEIRLKVRNTQVTADGQYAVQICSADAVNGLVPGRDYTLTSYVIYSGDSGPVEVPNSSGPATITWGGVL